MHHISFAHQYSYKAYHDFEMHHAHCSSASQYYKYRGELSTQTKPGSSKAVQGSGGVLQNFIRYRAISHANSSSGSRDNKLAQLGLQVALAERAATR